MPGGVLKPIPAPAERAIKRIVPNADWGALKFAAQQYQLEREHQPETPAQIRSSLDSIIERAAYLRRDLRLLKEESADAIGDWQLIDATAHQLDKLINASKIGHNQTTPRTGRPASLRKGFVRSVAAILKRGGYSADSTPNGVLVAVTAEFLNLYGDKPADVPALVRSALRENPAKSA